MRASVLLFVLSLGCLFAFATSAPVSSFSPSFYLGNGAFRTYFTQDTGVPTALGLEFSPAFFHDQPTFDSSSEHDHAEVNIDIPLPDEVPVYTPFQSFQLNYSPGHTAPYNKVHFDYHFYFQNAEIRVENITAGEGKKVCGEGGASPDTWCRGIKPFPAACCPPAYGNIGVVVPAMGAHLVDLMGAEMQPPDSPTYHPFQSQFTFGAFNGRITFYELMIATDYWHSAFVNTPNPPMVCLPIRLPQEFSDPGYYPSQYCMFMTAAGNLRVELNKFQHYAYAGCKGPVVPQLPCTLIAPPEPTKDFVKYCQCS